MKNPWKKLTPKGKYILFRTLAFIAAVAFPSAAALECFGLRGERITLTFPGTLGLGAFIVVSALLITFRTQVIGTISKHIGLPGFLVPAVLFLLFTGIEKSIDYISKFRVISLWWAIGALVGWGLSSVACIWWRGVLNDDRITNGTS